MRKGLFISVDGPNGAGKTTFIRTLVENLSVNYDVYDTREPSPTSFGTFVKKNEGGLKGMQYSQLKVKKGCKGIGRFLWLKAFDKVTVDSIYYEGNHWYSRTFDFALTGINPEQNAKESFHDVTG